MPEGALAFDRNGLSVIEPVEVAITLTNDVACLLVPGVNVLAIHAFNANRTSSDLLLDAQLVSTSDTSPPQITEIVPGPGASVRDLQQIRVFFDKNVAGVDASDLLINGIAASGVSAVSPREYSFSFPSPSPGVVQVAWATGHQIRDWASPANPFAGGPWSYRLDPTALPPSVVISEFMADNTAGIKDNDGSRSDWIELPNLGSEAVHLDGWALTDDPAPAQEMALSGMDLGAQRFPAGLGVGEESDQPGGAVPYQFQAKQRGRVFGAR